MRRIIIIGVALFCIILAVFTIYTGLPLFGVPKISDVRAEHDNTTAAMNELDTYKKTTFLTVSNRLQGAVEKCKTAKEEYDRVAQSQTEEQKEAALRSKTYDIEYLWVKLGNYANNSRIDFTLDVYKTEEANTENDYVLCDLKVTAISSYYGFIDFLEKISADPDLKMIPQNLKMGSEWKTVRVFLNSPNKLNIDYELNEINPEPDSPKLVLVSEFYKTDVPIKKDSLLKVENPESLEAEKKAAEEAAKNQNSTNSTNSTNVTNSSSNFNRVPARSASGESIR